MSCGSFVQAHAAHADWHVALAQSLRQIQIQVAARAAEQAASASFTLGWCYLTDYYAPEAEAILSELRRRLPGVAWVGTVGIGVAASGVEYIDEPALVLMLPRQRRFHDITTHRKQNRDRKIMSHHILLAIPLISAAC